MRHRDRGRWSRLLAVVFVTVAFFPGGLNAAGAGLDASWIWALNVLAHAEERFGRDVAFTYGPLGYLVYPHDRDGTWVAALALRVVFQAALAFGMAGLLGRADRTDRTTAWIVAICCAGVLWLKVEAETGILLLPLLALTSLVASDGRLGALAVLSALVPVCLCIKSSLGMLAMALWGSALLTWLLHDARAGLRAVLLAATAFAAVAAALAVVLFESPWGLLEWLRVASEFARGYSAAMSMPAYRWHIVLALGLLVGSAAWTVWWASVQRGAWRLAICAAPAALFLFKTAFVRQDSGHMMLFFGGLALVLIVQLTAVVDRQVRLANLVLIAGLVVAGTAVRLNMGGWTPSTGLHAATGVDGAVNIARWLWLDRTRAELSEAQPGSLAPARLPDAWVDAIRNGGGALDVIPYELAMCPANDVTWRPRPTLQSYAAYTRVLEAWDARHFRSERAPPFLLVHFDGIDFRNPYLDTPATWTAIRERYEVVGHTATPARALLRRRNTPVPAIVVERGGRTARIHEWVVLPEASGEIEAAIDLRLDWRGRLAEIFFRVPIVVLDVEYTNGEVARYRVIVDPLANGLVISRLPQSIDELVDVLSGQPARRVRRFRITDAGADYYGPGFTIRWRELRFPVSAADGAGARGS